MIQKLITRLHNFRYNTFIRMETYTVEWYRYDPENGRVDGFDHDQLTQFQNFTVLNQENFGGRKNYTSAEGDLILGDDFEIHRIDNNAIPDYFILKAAPEAPKDGALYSAMDIVLQNGIGDHHIYQLPFCVIGVRVGVEQGQFTTNF